MAKALKKVATVAVAVLVICGFFIVSPQRNPLAAQPAPTPTPPPFICSTSDISELIVPPPTGASNDAVRATIILRLSKCVADLSDARSKLSSTDPKSAQLAAQIAICRDVSGTVSELFERLSTCAAYDSSSTPPPIPYSSGHKAFYLLAPGSSDPIVAAVVLHAMADQLHRAIHGPDADNEQDTFDDEVHPWVVARVDWQLKDFAAQCEFDSNVSGALVLDNLVQQSATEFYILWQNGWTRVKSQAELIACPNPGNSAAPRLVAIQHNIEGGGYRNGFPFVAVAGVASFYAQNKNQTMVTTTPVPVPSASPGTVQQTTTTTNNATAPLILASVGSSLGTTTLPALNATSQLNSAALHYSRGLMDKLHGLCDRNSNRASKDPDVDAICSAMNSFSRR